MTISTTGKSANLLGMVEGRLLFVAYTPRGDAIHSFSREEPNRMNTADTTPTTPDPAEPIDWTRFDAMSAEARHRAALDDPDAQPLTEADFARMKRTPQAKLIRRALDLTQEEFAARYHIPLGTLRDWEQGRAEPDQATHAYLTVIARDPEGVQRALQPPSRS